MMKQKNDDDAVDDDDPPSLGHVGPQQWTLSFGDPNYLDHS